MRVAVGVDLGGTKTAAAVVDERGTILRRESVSSKLDADELLDALAELAEGLGVRETAGCGVGAAGLVDHSTGRYRYGPNLALREVDLGGRLGKALGVPVYVDNDANVATWAEHRFGCGRGTRDFLCVTLGTGVGGGIVANGRPYRGAHGGAAEIGHMLVDPDGPVCGCGRRGCWETVAAGSALERRAREGLAERADSALYGLTRGDPAQLTGPMVTDAARAGDAFARDVVDETARWIGLGLASLVNILEPERIAIAGGVVDDWDLFAGIAVETMRERVEAPEYRPLPDVVAAELGADAGIVGAALLVFDEEVSDP